MAHAKHNKNDAEALRRAIHGCGDYAHVTVRAQRGCLYVHADDSEPVARLTALGTTQYGLSFRQHTGRWEKMPVVGDLRQMAHVLTNELSAHLQRWDF